MAFRNPEDDEVPESEEDLEDLGDVGNFKGIYVRNLETGALIKRYPYVGGAGRGAPIAASADWIAVEVGRGIDFIHRESGTVREFRGVAALDVVTLQVARIREDAGVDIVPFAALV